MPSMPATLSRRQVRRVDEIAVARYGVPGIVLMENAGRGVADVLSGLGVRGPVVVCCGKGNNAGDGFVLARHLDLRGHEAIVLLWANADELAGDARTNYQILRAAGIRVESPGGDRAAIDRHLQTADWIVDALLGTGATGSPRPPLDGVIDRINAAAAPCLAVDLPSGLDCDTGAPALRTVEADETCTFVAMKPGFLRPESQRYTGRIHVLDIGVPRQAILDAAAEA